LIAKSKVYISDQQSSEKGIGGEIMFRSEVRWSAHLQWMQSAGYGHVSLTFDHQLANVIENEDQDGMIIYASVSNPNTLGFAPPVLYMSKYLCVSPVVEASDLLCVFLRLWLRACPAVMTIHLRPMTLGIMTMQESVH